MFLQTSNLACEAVKVIFTRDKSYEVILEVCKLLAKHRVFLAFTDIFPPVTDSQAHRKSCESKAEKSKAKGEPCTKVVRFVYFPTQFSLYFHFIR